MALECKPDPTMIEVSYEDRPSLLHFSFEHLQNVSETKNRFIKALFGRIVQVEKGTSKITK